MWGGRPRLRGEGGLCGEDGRDYEGRKVCMGRTAETAREVCCMGRTAETARGGKVVWVGRPRLRRRKG